MKSVELNNFVYRQTPESRFSHFEGTWEELEALVAQAFAADDAVRVTLRADGKIVKLVLPADKCAGFFSGVVLVDANTKLRSFFAVRDHAVEGERPFIQTLAVGGRKAPARCVEVILYHRDALTLEERTWPATTSYAGQVQDGEWQVVSVNARDTAEAEPPTLQAMARNMAAHLGLPEGKGGTPRAYTPQQFVESILYWSQRTMSGGSL